MSVRKAVIPAAGWGTRFLPMTKSCAKEMLPLIDKPLIQYAVEEAVEAGLSEVVIITAPGKHDIVTYFQASPELQAWLEKRGESRLARELAHLESLAKITFITQEKPLGLGHAILTARQAVGEAPFAVILPDDVIDFRQSALQQMLPVFEQRQASVIAVECIDTPDIRKYGVIRPGRTEAGVYHVESLVEKPEPEVAPSHLGIVGRYILTPQIFNAIARTPPDARNEIQLTDAISLLLKEQPIFALEFEGRRYDTGSPLGWLEAQVAFGLKRPELSDALRERLRRLI
jgi:UTP--glucose-1-phosphate uridylyltransferase